MTEKSGCTKGIPWESGTNMVHFESRLLQVWWWCSSTRFSVSNFSMHVHHHTWAVRFYLQLLYSDWYKDKTFLWILSKYSLLVRYSDCHIRSTTGNLWSSISFRRIRTNPSIRKPNWCLLEGCNNVHNIGQMVKYKKWTSCELYGNLTMRQVVFGSSIDRSTGTWMVFKWHRSVIKAMHISMFFQGCTAHRLNLLVKDILAATKTKKTGIIKKT